MEYHKAASMLRRIHSDKKQAQEAVDKATSAISQRDGHHKAAAHREAADCQDSLNRVLNCEAQVKRQLAEHAEQVKRLLNADFDIMVSDSAIVKQYEEQLRNESWRMGPS